MSVKMGNDVENPSNGKNNLTRDEKNDLLVGVFVIIFLVGSLFYFGNGTLQALDEGRYLGVFAGLFVMGVMVYLIYLIIKAMVNQ